MSKRVLCVLVVALALVTGAAQAGPVGSLFNPNDPGGFNAVPFVPAANVTFDYQNGTLFDGTTTWTGALEANASGNVQMWVFRFPSVNVGAGITIAPSATSPTQKPGLVLASRGDLTFDGTLDLPGTAGSGGTPGAGGPGAEGGVRNTSVSSSPPPTNAGNGGAGGGSGATGIGYGASPGGYQASGGAGYGGAGAPAYDQYGNIEASGGVGYGDDLLTDLYGGSGAGGTNNLGGAGGGGAVELIALGTLTLGGTINVYGADGTGGGWTRPSGGGSGGGVILAADLLSVSGTVNAYGGDGGTSASLRAAGGGGGGRVAWYTNNLLAGGPANVSVAGGESDNGGPDNPIDGNPGSFRYPGDGGAGDLSFPLGGGVVPEPAALGLAGLALLALRRRSRRA